VWSGTFVYKHYYILNRNVLQNCQICHHYSLDLLINDNIITVSKQFFFLTVGQFFKVYSNSFNPSLVRSYDKNIAASGQLNVCSCDLLTTVNGQSRLKVYDYFSILTNRRIVNISLCEKMQQKPDSYNRLNIWKKGIQTQNKDITFTASKISSLSNFCRDFPFKWWILPDQIVDLL